MSPQHDNRYRGNTRPIESRQLYLLLTPILLPTHVQSRLDYTTKNDQHTGSGPGWRSCLLMPTPEIEPSWTPTKSQEVGRKLSTQDLIGGLALHLLPSHRSADGAVADGARPRQQTGSATSESTRLTAVEPWFQAIHPPRENKNLLLLQSWSEGKRLCCGPANGERDGREEACAVSG